MIKKKQLFLNLPLKLSTAEIEAIGAIPSIVLYPPPPSCSSAFNSKRIKAICKCNN